MKQLNYRQATSAQIRSARKFAEEHSTMSLSQCVKYLEYIFAYKRGELSAEDFLKQTGHKAEFIKFDEVK